MLTEYRTNKNSLTVTQQGTKAFRPITVNPGDHASIPEFLKRIYIEHFDEVVQINIKLNDTSHLVSDPNYILYNANLEVTFTDKVLHLDWQRCLVSPFKLVRTIHYFIFSAFVCGLQDKVTINNTKLNSVEDYLPFMMHKMFKHQYVLKNKEYLNAFFKAEKAGKETLKLLSKGQITKAQNHVEYSCMNIYTDSIDMEYSFRPKTLEEIKQSNKAPILELADKRSVEQLGIVESTLMKISSVLKLQTSLRLR